MGRKEFDEDVFFEDYDGQDEESNSVFGSLYNSDNDTCPHCGEGPLVLRAKGYRCPSTQCAKVVFAHEDV